MAKPCSHPNCTNPRWKNNPENQKEGWCKNHIPTGLRLNVKKTTPKSYAGNSFLKQKRKPTGEAVLYKAIWAVREHVSFVSGEPVEFGPTTFAHVLPKGLYPKFRLYDKNIVLLTPEEHYALDFGTEEDREKLPGDWEKLYKLRGELKQEYGSGNKN